MGKRKLETNTEFERSIKEFNCFEAYESEIIFEDEIIAGYRNMKSFRRESRSLLDAAQQLYSFDAPPAPSAAPQVPVMYHTAILAPEPQKIVETEPAVSDRKRKNSRRSVSQKKKKKPTVIINNTITYSKINNITNNIMPTVIEPTKPAQVPAETPPHVVVTKDPCDVKKSKENAVPSNDSVKCAPLAPPLPKHPVEKILAMQETICKADNVVEASARFGNNSFTRSYPHYYYSSAKQYKYDFSNGVDDTQSLKPTYVATAKPRKRRIISSLPAYNHPNANTNNHGSSVDASAVYSSNGSQNWREEAIRVIKIIQKSNETNYNKRPSYSELPPNENEFTLYAQTADSIPLSVPATPVVAPFNSSIALDESTLPSVSVSLANSGVACDAGINGSAGNGEEFVYCPTCIHCNPSLRYQYPNGGVAPSSALPVIPSILSYNPGLVPKTTPDDSEDRQNNNSLSPYVNVKVRKTKQEEMNELLSGLPLSSAPSRMVSSTNFGFIYVSEFSPSYCYGISFGKSDPRNTNGFVRGPVSYEKVYLIAAKIAIETIGKTAAMELFVASSFLIDVLRPGLEVPNNLDYYKDFIELKQTIESCRHVPNIYLAENMDNPNFLYAMELAREASALLKQNFTIVYEKPEYPPPISTVNISHQPQAIPSAPSAPSAVNTVIDPSASSKYTAIAPRANSLLSKPSSEPSTSTKSNSPNLNGASSSYSSPNLPGFTPNARNANSSSTTSNNNDSYSTHNSSGAVQKTPYQIPPLNNTTPPNSSGAGISIPSIISSSANGSTSLPNVSTGYNSNRMSSSGSQHPNPRLLQAGSPNFHPSFGNNAPKNPSPGNHPASAYVMRMNGAQPSNTTNYSSGVLSNLASPLLKLNTIEDILRKRPVNSIPSGAHTNKFGASADSVAPQITLPAIMVANKQNNEHTTNIS